MSSFRTMPCISSSSKVAILSCFKSSQVAIHSPVVLSTLYGRNPTSKIFSQLGGIPAQSLRWRTCCGEAFKGTSSNKKRNSSSSSDWGYDFYRFEWGLSRVRTFASSPQGSEENSSGDFQTEKEKVDVSETLKRGLLLDAAEALEEKLNKPEICSADELHYVAVPGTTWRLALWRYRPPPDAPQRNHPVLMLSGIGTNAIGFDLEPSVSLARSIAGAGFDTWILEVRGSGLSKSEEELADEGKEAKSSSGVLVENKAAPEDDKADLPENGSSKSTSEQKAATALDPQTKGTVAERNPSKKKSSEPSSEETPMVLSDIKSEKPSEPKDGALSVAERKESTAISQKPDGGVNSWQTWKTATDLTNFIIEMSNKLSNFLTQGHSKILPARLTDSVSKTIEESTLAKRITELRERLSGLLEAQQNSTVVMQEIADLRKKLAQLIEDGQDVLRPRVTDIQERMNTTVDDFQKIVDLIAKYDWDFDNYLDEDVPTAMEYVLNQCKPVDGKLLSVGHSMGGIVLYAMLSKRGNDCGLAGAVALASALDYQCSDTSLKLLLPLTSPAQLVNVPVVPLGALMTAVHPLVTKPPYALAWLGYQVSAQNMMKPELFSKLVLNNFGTIPVKLLLHLATVFQPGGLANRDGTFKYKQNIGKVTVPVLAIAGDRDLICPPVAVLDTVNLFPKDTVTYKCVGGGENNRHYGHYDIVCSPAATEEVFPVILDFLLQNDTVKLKDKEKIEVPI